MTTRAGKRMHTRARSPKPTSRLRRLPMGALPPLRRAHPEATERTLPVSAAMSNRDARIAQYVNRWGWRKDREAMRAELIELLAAVTRRTR